MPRVETTLSIIKPDAIKRNIIGQVISLLETAGLIIVAQKMITLTQNQAMEFYNEHKNRPFFNSLIQNMSLSPIIVQVLQAPNAILLNRQVMGHTNPTEAEIGTIRRTFGIDIEQNTVHGSDSLFAATREIEFFFSKIEIYSQDIEDEKQ